MMKDNEKKALEIITPYITEVVRFHRNRTLHGNIELRTKLAEAYYELTNDKNSANHIRTGSCGSCSTKALDALYRLHEQSLSKIGSGDGDKKNKPLRGRPRKKPTSK